MGLDAGQILGGKYRLTHPLGEGGMGAVWAADDVQLGREVAVKVLSANLDEAVAHKRFLREAQLAAQLRSPHVAQVFDFGMFDGRAFIVMEHLAGEDLERRLARGPLPLEAVVTLIDGACAALAEAHACGIVHRDIKPANLFFARIGSREIVKVLDFGIATRLRGSGPLTAEGTIIGTPLYMSPEQSQGLDLDHRSDLWSLAVVAYEALTGVQPFEAKTDWASLAAIVKRPIQPPSELVPNLPASIDELFRRALRRTPSERCASAEQLAAAFAAAASGDHPFALDEATDRATADTAPMAVEASQLRRANTDVVAIDDGRETRPMRVPPIAWVAALVGLGGAVYFGTREPPASALRASAGLVPTIELPAASIDADTETTTDPAQATPSVATSSDRAATIAPGTKPRSRPSVVAPKRPEPAAAPAAKPRSDVPRPQPAPAKAGNEFGI